VVSSGRLCGKVGSRSILSARRSLAPDPNPVEANLLTAYWLKRGAIPPDMDLYRDHCIVIWVCPSFPFNSAQIKAAELAA